MGQTKKEPREVCEVLSLVVLVQRLPHLDEPFVLARGGKAGELVRVRKVRALQRHKGGVKQHGVGIASEWLGHKEELC